jgi:hypothetical protein
MKKIAIFLFLIVFLGLVSWACRRPLPVFPTPPGIATPTSTVTPSNPVCGFTPVSNSVPVTITPVVTVIIATPSAYTPVVYTPSPVDTPAITYPNPPIPFTGVTNVFTTLAQFQALFNWVPSVNFSTQMVLEAALPEGCQTNDSITSVCEGPTQIIVDLTESHPAPNSIQCFAQGLMLIPIAVNQSNLPVVWQITEVVN